MLNLKTKKELSQDAHTLAGSFHLVRYSGTTYLPMDFESESPTPPPVGDRTVWTPLSRDDLRRVAAQQFHTLFSSDGELASFDFMVAQFAQEERGISSELLVRTEQGLRKLTASGSLVDVDGGFVPNYIHPMLVVDQALKDEVFATISDWVDGDDEARSLLHHLATCLSPGWSAVKYVLLLGEGRNGKSVLLKMLASLFGKHNVSHVTRQHISEQSPVVIDLNGKLLNLIFDGQAAFLKDSGTEKSLIAGEPAPIRRLYESVPTMVQTNALFVEALNREPKSGDKSQALQKRLVRFQFSKTFPLNAKFEKRMLSPEILGAFLALLLDHYVLEEELAEKLQPSSKSEELQQEYMFINSPALQFVQYVDQHGGLNSLIGQDIDHAAKLFRGWRMSEGDTGTWSTPDIQTQLRQAFIMDRKTRNTPSGPRKVRLLIGLTPETEAFLSTNQEGADSEILAAMVED